MNKHYLAILSAVVALFLLGLNGYGLTQSLRPYNIEVQDLRFGARDQSLSLAAFRQQVVRQEGETAMDYKRRVTQVVAQGLAHIHWEDYDPTQFNQRVPAWENYILYLMGVFKVMPEYERYHFADLDRSMERGIGICGDASMVLSNLFDRYGIDNNIVVMPGHVMVEAYVDGQAFLLDPDYGIPLAHSAEYFQQSPAELIDAFSAAGYPRYDGEFVANAISDYYFYYDGVDEFIQKKYYFEYFAYVAKWVIPLLLLLGSWWLVKSGRKPEQLADSNG